MLGTNVFLETGGNWNHWIFYG